jgi:5-keto 4-deoxyuronate isomerase
MDSGIIAGTSAALSGRYSHRSERSIHIVGIRRTDRPLRTYLLSRGEVAIVEIVGDGTIAVQDAAQVVERPADVHVGNINVPMLMGGQQLREARTFFDGLAFHLDSSPTWLSTRHTLDGLTATMSTSSIMNVSRR